MLSPRAFLVSLFTLFALIPLSQPALAQSQTLSMVSGGQERSYQLFMPQNVSASASMPLVIMLHGGFGTAAQAERSYNWDREAEAHSFVVAYPDGIGRTWNAGGTCCGKANQAQIHDIKFLTELIENIKRRVRIDPRRVYLTGMSNGAAMSYYYACHGTYPIAAIGPVSGSLTSSCDSPRPVSVMEIHGLADENIPINGGYGTKGVARVEWLGVPRTLAYFQRSYQCAAPVVDQGGIVRTETSTCANGLETILKTIAGAGHQWPGGVQRLHSVFFQPDPPSQALDATDTLWSFFSRHSAS